MKTLKRKIAAKWSFITLSAIIAFDLLMMAFGIGCH